MGVHHPKIRVNRQIWCSGWQPKDPRARVKSGHEEHVISVCLTYDWVSTDSRPGSLARTRDAMFLFRQQIRRPSSDPGDIKTREPGRLVTYFAMMLVRNRRAILARKPRNYTVCGGRIVFALLFSPQWAIVYFGGEYGHRSRYPCCICVISSREV